MEPRLEKRYQQLVRAHMQPGYEVAAGIKSSLNENVAFSQTQAAWRFFNNERCTLRELSQPLLHAAHESSEKECDSFILMLHDWSYLGYNKHTSKKDTYNTFKACVGYDLQSSLAISDRQGAPLALVAMNLKTKNETWSSYEENLPCFRHLEELPKRIHWLESQNFSKPLVHIVDREGDSAGFFRSFSSDTHWLIRVKGSSRASDGMSKKIKDIVKDLEFSQVRAVEYKATPAHQLIAETQIAITRPAVQGGADKKEAKGKRPPPLKGPPVQVRLIVSRVVDNSGKELATWYLLSNMVSISAATLALWYYWRWSIENYFKLMKSAGMQLESWQQTTGLAIARRLLVASMACVCVWQIAHAKGSKAGELRRVLVRLSGRQMKWKVEFTYNALLAGLWALLAMEDMLSNCGVEKIRSLLDSVFPEKELV